MLPIALSTRRQCTQTPVLTQRKSVQRHLTEVGILRRTCWQARRVHNAIRRDPATSRRRERCEWCWSEISGSSAAPSRPSCRRGVEKGAAPQQGLDTRLPQRRPPVGRPRVPSRTLQRSCFSDLLGWCWTEEKQSQAAPSDPFLLEKGCGMSDHGYTPLLLRIRRAETIATFPLFSLPSRRGMEDDHDHSSSTSQDQKGRDHGTSPHSS